MLIYERKKAASRRWDNTFFPLGVSRTQIAEMLTTEGNGIRKQRDCTLIFFSSMKRCNRDFITSMNYGILTLHTNEHTYYNIKRQFMKELYDIPANISIKKF